MKVCDKCRQPIQKSNTLLLKGKKAELCNDCAEKIIQWLAKQEKPNPLKDIIFGGRN